MSARKFTLDGLAVTQPIGEFYVVVMSPSQLTKIAYADVRALDDRELDTYLGIQRRLDKKRVSELRDYVKTTDASFPTSILLAVESEHASWDQQSRKLTIRSAEDGDYSYVGKILDGQHRVAGLQDYDGEEFEVCVCIFIDADLADQASIFSTVNLAQTKVNKSLVYDLYEYQKARSPQKTSHNVALALDRFKTGPFYKRIKRLGFANAPGQFLTQATVVEEIIKLISRDAAKDRDDLIRGRKLGSMRPEDFDKTPFRKMFASGKDADIAENITNYFLAVRDRWPNAWGGAERGQILPKTNGFKSLMWGLGEFYRRQAADKTEVFGKQQYGRFLARVELDDADFNTDNFKPGSAGQATLKEYLRGAF